MSYLGEALGFSWGLPQLVLLFVAAQRIVEIEVARQNTSELLARGAMEIGARHYPLFILLHGSWLLAMFLLLPAEAPVNFWLLGIFALAQIGRIWVIASLGRYWTTRVISLPEAPLVRKGPYRFIKHPNYAVVAVEIASLPLAFGAWELALVFSILNAMLLWYRIRVENNALGPRRSLT